MLIESFIIFLTTLVNINTVTEHKTPTQPNPSEVQKTPTVQPPAPVGIYRGGWDFN